MIHILHHSTLRLCRSLFLRFILFVVIAESDDLLNIDLEDPDVLKYFNSIFIGAMASIQGTVTSLEPLSTIDIFSPPWKTPSYVR